MKSKDTHWASRHTVYSHGDFVGNSLEKKRPIGYNIYLTKFGRRKTEDERRKTEDRRQKTEDGRQMTEGRAASVSKRWLMKNPGQYKFPKALSDTDLRRFTLVFGLYCFNPCSSVESVVNDLLYKCRGSSTNRPFFAKQSQFAGGAKFR